MSKSPHRSKGYAPKCEITSAFSLVLWYPDLWMVFLLASDCQQRRVAKPEKKQHAALTIDTHTNLDSAIIRESQQMQKRRML